MIPQIITVDWEPQERQLLALKACGLSEPFPPNLEVRPTGTRGEAFGQAIADIIGYGGSAGGGKTDTLLAIGIIAAINYPRLNVGYFRREFPQLEGPGGAIMRSQEMIGHFCKYNEQKHRWTFPTQSIMQFCHCKDPNDVYNYQSQQFDILLIDEVTQFTREMVKYLLTRNRGTVTFSSFKPFACFATNPGNVGHGFFKDEFVTLGEPEKVQLFWNETGKAERHIFIPSKLNDNQILVKRDPGYADRVGNTEMNKKILLEGSWDVFAGQAFGELSRDIHLIDPFPIPVHWKKFGAFDYGYNHPYSFGVFSVDEDGNVYLIARSKDRLKRVDEIAKAMVETCGSIGGLKQLSSIEAGHDCWVKTKKQENDLSVAELFAALPKRFPELGLPPIYLRQAHIDRIAGATQLRTFLAYKNTTRSAEGVITDGTPRFYIFRNLSQVYDTLSEMIFDPDKPEDVLKVDADENGQGGDDDYDMVRYGLMSRPKPLPQKIESAPKDSFFGYLQKKQQERWSREELYSY